MAKTKIFLSSTCYDLRAVREHLRSELEGCGHELLVSEYASFPVSPNLTTVENCKKVIEDHADLLILIIGGRRGSLDAATDRSVVNVEYLAARAKGIDCFVFVDLQVWNLLPIYVKNPTADFSPIVGPDDVGVFKFIAELRNESRWIFTFARTEDIITTSKTQLSTYLRSLISRARGGHLALPGGFVAESETVRSIVQDRPRFWEFLLTAELMDRAVKRGRQRMTDLEGGVLYRPSESVRDEDIRDRAGKFCSDLGNAIAPFKLLVTSLQTAMGPPGVAGDPAAIREACARVSTMVDHLIDWETQLRYIRVSTKYEPLFASLRGSTVDVLDQLALLPTGIRSGVVRAQTDPGDHSIKIDLVLKAPQTLAGFERELLKLDV